MHSLIRFLSALLPRRFAAFTPALLLAAAFPAAPLFSQPASTAYHFITYAGPAAGGGVDGTGSAAQFRVPAGTAVDQSGNVYVADSQDNTIRKITAAGAVTTLAGTAGNPGSADGIGAAALFSDPNGIALDGSGNVYVADSTNDTIREITANGAVVTLAGTAGSQGSADGTGAAARFYFPEGITLDGAGNLYVADSGNDTIRKIVPTPSNGSTVWVVTTIAGTAGMAGSANGTGAAARFRQPDGLAVNASGIIYVADKSNSTIRKITPTSGAWVVTTLAGTAGTLGSADGSGAAAQFGGPFGIALDGSGNLYVSDTSNDIIRKITPAGAVKTMAGTAEVQGSADGAGAAAQFRQPEGVAADASGNLYVADSGNNTVRKITPTLNGTATVWTTTTLAGSTGFGHQDGTASVAKFDTPYGAAVDGSGNVYVADTDNDTIRKIAPGSPATVATLAGTAGLPGSADATGAAARFNFPHGVAVDGSGNVYVADTDNDTIRKITPAGAVTTLAGKAGVQGSTDATGSAAQFFLPAGLAVDAAGNVYVADSGNNTIRKITPAGAVTTLAGTANPAGGSQDGTGSAAQFSDPTSVAVDGSGNVYVVDSGNFTIRKIAPGGFVTTFAGTPGSFGSADGTGSAAQFRPYGVAVDASGNVYVGDSGNDTIRGITPAGVVTTLAGSSGFQGNADGTGTAALFNQPHNLAVGEDGSIYVADTGNNTMRQGAPSQTPGGGAVSMPVFTTQPLGQAVSSGSTVVFFSTASGGGLSYQWKKDGANLADSPGGASADVILGSSGNELMITNATQASAGQYTLVVTNSLGTATSNAAALQVIASSNPGLVTSISIRAFVGTGDNILIGGFFIAGSTSRTVLVQAIGPALGQFGVTGFLAHPTLSIHQTQSGGDVTLYSNTGWGSSQVLANAAASVFASPAFQAGSADSELLLTLPPGGYSAEVSGADGGSGVALCAIYELP